jgi:hypothetical protein
LDADHSLRHFRDVRARRKLKFPMPVQVEKPGLISHQDELPAEPLAFWRISKSSRLCRRLSIFCGSDRLCGTSQPLQ